MSKIFISYRRENDAPHAGRLYDHLATRFGETHVFMDIDNMRVGLDFVEQIEQAVQACDVLIAVIGKTWLTVTDEAGNRRLENPHDFVRLEIQAALDRNIPVIPLLMGEASMPKASELPEALEKLARRHAMKMSHERFRSDATRLMEQISDYVREADSAEEPLPTPQDNGKAIQARKPKATPRSEPLAAPQPKATIPEGMVLIPKGPFLYGEKEEEKKLTIDYDYYMDVHPIINAAYATFMEAGGYSNQAYWSPEGWAWKEKEKITQPKYWTDSTWNQKNQPIVGVSYYEAEAYAKWAGKRLPTEQEWEKAARGTDGRFYPWGDEFDSSKCNSNASGIEKTTPIGSYPQGHSLYGCQDMAGNVQEWCASWYDQSKNFRMVRGGSWDNLPVNLRSSDRFRFYSVNRFYDIGFRLAQDIP